MDRAAERLLPNTPLTDEQKQSLEDILDACEDWQQQRGSLNAVMHLGLVPGSDGKPSPGRSRFVAAWLNRRDPRTRILEAIQDRVNDHRHKRNRQGYYLDPEEVSQLHQARTFLRSNDHKQAA